MTLDTQPIYDSSEILNDLGIEHFIKIPGMFHEGVPELMLVRESVQHFSNHKFDIDAIMEIICFLQENFPNHKVMFRTCGEYSQYIHVEFYKLLA